MRIIEIVADAGHCDTLQSIVEQHEIIDKWCSPPGEDGRSSYRLLVTPERAQDLLDALQSVLGSSDTARIVVMPVEATLPRVKSDAVATSREELYNDIAGGARPDRTFFLLTFLATVVAGIGLLENNVAVVVGAMVIAPLLGPNLALALASALGDRALMRRALATNALGLGFTLLLAVLIGLLWGVDLSSHELMSRTEVGLESVVLALASGAAAVLSLATGLPSALVGVMVAVALLPPAAVVGMMLGTGHWDYALDAALLLAVNVVCVNLAANVVFLLKGLKPRTWLEKRKARQSILITLGFWLLSLLVLVWAILRAVPGLGDF